MNEGRHFLSKTLCQNYWHPTEYFTEGPYPQNNLEQLKLDKHTAPVHVEEDEGGKEAHSFRKVSPNIN